MKNIGHVKSIELENRQTTTNESFSPVEKSIRSLDKATRLLEVLGISILLLTILNLGSLAFAQISPFKDLQVQAFVFSWVVFFIVSVLLYIHERFHKKGDVLFEEISDELEWNISSDKAHLASEMPNIDRRVVLRSFVKITDLPFIQGKYGEIFYLLLNVAIPILMGVLIFRV